MGNPASKIGHEVKEVEITQGSVPSTPILTPKVSKNLNFDCDPRSPSASIIRTPIQSEIAPNLEEVSTPVKILDIDPRSPAYEFDRTPIVVKQTPNLPGIRQQNRNADNVRKTILCSNALKVLESTPKENIPPKLIETCTKTVKQMEKRKSFVGLLETNMDYVETDLDAVILNATPSKKSLEYLEASSTPNTPVAVVQAENVDPRSPTLDFMRTPIQIIKKVGEIDINDDYDVEDTINKEVEKKETQGVLKVDIPASSVNSQEKILDEADRVKDFDKKLSNLIYEDKESEVMSSKINKTKKDNSRTPLGARNSNSTTVKSVSKLKVSDKPRKSDHSGSKIPVFKEKLIKGKLHPCENTPPRSVEPCKNKIKKSQWDPDNTLII